MLSFRLVKSMPLILGALLCQTGYAQLSKGNQILLDRGLQLQGLSQDDCYLHLDTYSNANYTSINWINGFDGSGQPVHSSRPDWMGDAPGFTWSRWAQAETQMPPQITPYGGDETPPCSSSQAALLLSELSLQACPSSPATQQAGETLPERTQASPRVRRAVLR